MHHLPGCRYFEERQTQTLLFVRSIIDALCFTMRKITKKRLKKTEVRRAQTLVNCASEKENHRK